MYNIDNGIKELERCRKAGLKGAIIWQAPHPDWNDEQWWPELVSSYALEIGDDVLLFDPLAVPEALWQRAQKQGYPGERNLDTAVEAMKRGAYDYVSKPFKPDEILLTLRKAVSLAPRSLTPRLTLVNAYLDAHQPADALSEARRALAVGMAPTRSRTGRVRSSSNCTYWLADHVMVCLPFDPAIWRMCDLARFGAAQVLYKTQASKHTPETKNPARGRVGGEAPLLEARLQGRKPCLTRRLLAPAWP